MRVLTLLAATAVLSFVLTMTASAQTLIKAAEQGDTATIERLLAGGAAIDSADAAGQTPLLLAVQNNHLAAAIRLIDGGADINAQATNRDTPWLLAGALGRTAMLGHMFPRGPDFAIRNRYGGNALVGSSRVDLQACKLEYSIVSPK